MSIRRYPSATRLWSEPDEARKVFRGRSTRSYTRSTPARAASRSVVRRAAGLPNTPRSGARRGASPRRVSRLGAAALWLGAVSLYGWTIPGAIRAQDNYEIQVYGSETEAPGTTMLELHSNYTLNGRKSEQDGLWPTDHALHETLEITHGFTTWFETAFYVFTSARGSQGWQWVGDHLRPRVRVPPEWGWPVGVSLSGEIGYQRPRVSLDTWTWEIRPIVDKQLGRWYLSANPALEHSIRGPSVAKGVEFSPAGTVGYDVSSGVNVAVEYYGAWGPIQGFEPAAQQQHQLFGAINLNLGPGWEFNAGLGEGFTHGTDHLIAKVILGRRLPR